ncbi:MAG: multiheme c-type cytochrome, partial [Planctomycetota bacterium]|nr:multiheme c-type cytochrome [Planctomycetota bacterium]
MPRISLITAAVVAVAAANGLAQMRGGGGMGGGRTSGGTSLTTFTTDDFSGSGNCTFCHSDRIDSTGRDVSMDRQWRSTMMANAARDPLWQAKVSSEVNRNPELRDVIEDKCSRCHMPMARVQAVTEGTPVTVFDDGFLSATHHLHEAAMDGVSCSLCHQIDESGLGAPASFTGNYVIDTTTSSPYRWIYGSFAQPFQRPMQMNVGYTPVHGAHVNDSAYCGTCHTLYTPVVDMEGNIVGEFPEQTPYLEWEHSAYSETGENKHCQDCHMPEGAGMVALSNRPRRLSARFPVGQHIFVGGNSFLLGILNTHGTELGVTADAAHLDATTDLTIGQLTRQTAQLSLLSQDVKDGVFTGVLHVSNLAGHKFPTGVPIRRAWLHVRVTDEQGRLVFESGAPWSDGRIVGNDADDLATAFEPHYDVITSDDQV